MLALSNPFSKHHIISMVQSPPQQKKQLCAVVIHFVYEKKHSIVGSVYKFSLKYPYFYKSCLNRFAHSSRALFFVQFIVSIITTSTVNYINP
jgi:hypothetical protein